MDNGHVGAAEDTPPRGGTSEPTGLGADVVTMITFRSV
jgi:hypothetical protein